ncbi:9162_t:CDS:2, partial [Paraglomus occultum]
EFTSGLKELEEGEGDIRGIAGIDNGKVVSIAWWSIDSIILGYQHGSVIIFSYLKAKNILSDTPEIFKSCREITSRIENRVLLIEHEIKAIRARVHGENIVSYSRAQEEDDLVDGNDTESLLQRIASAIGNSLHYVTDTFLWNFESDSSSIRGKFITIPKRTFRLNRITKILPQELLYRKINTLEYDTALAIAETYNLDTDIIYQARWRDTEISEESIHECLDKIHNREWVITNCLDRIPNAPLPACAEMIRLLLAYGLKQTDILDDILANVSYKDLALKLRKDPLECDPTLEETLRNLPLSEDQRNMCRYRHYFLHYLDRLRTFEDITSAKSRRDMALGLMYSSFDMGGWTPFVDYSSTFAEDYAIFRDIDIAAQAMDYAADEFFEGLLILFTRHGSETLPYRYTILEQIPETADPSAYEVFLSRVSSVNGEEAEECLWNEQPWREPDWVENPILKQQFVVEEPAEREFDGIWLKPVSYPAKSSFITQWYYKRAHAIDAMSGQVDKALQLVRYGIRKNVQGLETLEENLDMLYKLVYECCPSLESVSTGTTLCEFEALSEAGIVEIFLRHTDENRVVNDVQKFILPYLDLLPARRARMSSQSSSVVCDHALPASECEPMEILYKYILKSSTEQLGVCCCLFEASAVTLAEDQRIISSSIDLARLILSCAYGNERTDQWDIITRMTNSLPTFDTSEDMDLSVEDKKDLGRLDTESLFSNLKTKNVYEIQVLINDLYIHLDVAKTLARYHIPVPLKWFFCSLEDRDLQKKLCIQLARVSNNDGLGYGERFSTINGWTTLLDDMLNIQKSVLNKIPSKEVVQDFISGLLYAGRFDYARKILLPENQETIFDLGLIEKIVIESSRELFDKAASGSRRSGYMKMAYECLQIVPISPATQAEMDFIEATEQLLERKLSHKLDMSLRPIHIRHEKDRLSLIERFLRADEKGYLDLENALELARKLGFRGDRVAELKVHVMVAKAALRNANYKYAFDVCMIIINETKAFENSIEGRKNPTLLRTMKDVTWRACLDVGRKKEMPDLENRKTLLAYALVNCTKENMLDILNDWRLVESEHKEMMRRKAAEPKQESTQKVKLVANVQPAGEPVSRFVQAISSWLS